MKILMCSYFKFPAECAGAIRHEKIAHMLQHMGHDVLVVGIGKFNNFDIGVYKNIKYISLRYKSSNLIGKIRTRVDFWKNLKNEIEDYEPDYIIMDDLRPFVISKLKKYSRKNKIVLIHDSVEWYSKEQFKLGVFAPAFIKKNIVNKFMIDKNCRVIAISQYLTDHFSSKQIECVNIPIFISDDDLVEDKILSDTINFTYAGQAGKKDYIHVILSAIELLTEEERKKIKFHILGCTLEQILKSSNMERTIAKILPCLEIYGRVPREKVIDVLKFTDFTILIRSDKQRYAKAGFPTKVVESLSHSTPVIANLTSDLHRYLIDDYNALIVEKCSSESLAIVLKKAIALSEDKRLMMCRNAYSTALNKLYYKQFVTTIEKLFH